MYGEIYYRFCPAAQKGYIGQTINGEKERWNSDKYKGCSVMERAVKKYGKEGFQTTILVTAETKEELDQLETYFIKELNTLVPYGYNLKSGGGSHGKHHPETCRLIAELQRGRKLSEETCKKMSQSLLGNTYRLGTKHSAKTRQKMSVSARGKPKSEEHCKNISKGKQGQKCLGYNRSLKTHQRMSAAGSRRHLRDFLTAVAWG